MAEPGSTDRTHAPLLEVLTRQALDEDYAHVAARRGDRPVDGAARGSRRPGLAGAAVVATFGVLVAVAAVQTQRTSDVRDAGRAALVERIEARRDLVATQQGRLSDLRDSNARLERDLQTTTTEEQTADAVRVRLAARTGFGAVTGPGVRVTVDSAEGAEDQAVLRDSDLALLVNGLWSAGSEAIAVNGQRMTAVSAIRTSGTAVEVNGTGIAPPYVVTAIGDPLTLEADLFQTSSGLAFDSLAQTYGFTYDIEAVGADGTDGADDTLSLPAAPARLSTLRWAGDDEPDGGVAPLPGEEQ